MERYQKARIQLFRVLPPSCFAQRASIHLAHKAHANDTNLHVAGGHIVFLQPQETTSFKSMLRKAPRQLGGVRSKSLLGNRQNVLVVNSCNIIMLKNLRVNGLLD